MFVTVILYHSVICMMYGSPWIWLVLFWEEKPFDPISSVLIFVHPIGLVQKSTPILFFFKVWVGMALKWSLESLYLILISLSLIKNEGIHQQMQQLRLFLCFLSLCCSTCYIAVFINFSSCYWLSSFLCFVSSPCIWICCQIFVVIKNCENCILSDGSIISVTSYC